MSVDELLERAQWDLFWVPSDVTVIERPGLIYSRVERDVAYLNCVVRNRVPANELHETISEVKSAHGEYTSRWTVYPSIHDATVQRMLDAQGYEARQEHLCCVAPVDLRTAMREDIEVRRVETMDALKEGLAVRNAVFGIDGPRTEDAFQRELALCASTDSRKQRFVAYRSGEPVAYAGITFFRDLGFASLWGGCTLTHARGRGVYRALVATRMAAAEQRGIDRVGLHAQVDTSAPIVSRLGFTAHGRMIHWDHVPLKPVR